MELFIEFLRLAGFMFFFFIMVCFATLATLAMWFRNEKSRPVRPETIRLLRDQCRVADEARRRAKQAVN